MIRHVGPCAGVVCLLGLPGDHASLDVDLPAAGAGAVHAMSRAHDLVVLPAQPIGLLPRAVLTPQLPQSAREGLARTGKEREAIKKKTHAALVFSMNS